MPIDDTNLTRVDVEHPILHQFVHHPNTGTRALVTRCITTRFGILANLDGDNQTAWRADTLTPYHAEGRG
jgi:hypothetical protein